MIAQMMMPILLLSNLTEAKQLIVFVFAAFVSLQFNLFSFAVPNHLKVRMTFSDLKKFRRHQHSQSGQNIWSQKTRTNFEEKKRNEKLLSVYVGFNC